MTTIRISAPKIAKAGDVIPLKAMIKHDMESGYRRDQKGDAIARDIITLFECLYNDELVFSADFHPAISANPFLSFHTIATESGTLTFRWTDQHGKVWSETADLTVE